MGATPGRRLVAALLPLSARRILGSVYGWVATPTSSIESARIWRDTLAFRHLRRVFNAGGSGDKGVAMAVSLSGWTYQLKIEGMLLKGLETGGYRPLVATDSGSARRSRGYMRTFAINTLPIERYATGHAEEAAALLEGDLTAQWLKTLTYRGANVGQHVLSSLSRTLFRGSVSLDDDTARQVVLELLPRSMAMVHTAERLLDAVDPKLLLFNEPRYAIYGPIFETALARGYDVVQFVHAFSDDALVFKRYTEQTKRVHPRSLGAESWREVKEGPWSEAMETELWQSFDRRYAGNDSLSRRMYSHTRAQSAEELVRRLGLDPDKRTAVLFSHVLWDANLFYGDDLFADQEEWLVETVRAAAANDQLNWIVKLHPANVWKRELEGVTGELPELEAIERRVGELPSHVCLLLPESDVSAQSLFAVADFGITIRGTVGVEAPCFGIPVVTGGTSHYSGRGFTLDSATREAYLDLLGRLQDEPQLDDDAVRLARMHAHALFCRRPLAFTSFRSHVDRRGGSSVLRQNLQITVSSPEELASAADLAKFASWVESGREDYLRPLVETPAFPRISS